ncbi:ABC transporter substrate-binding protein [Castellaniella sp. GW247-6E4]|uniref:ABC transporter substrate-binding protein n=1 Tax=Castellaniella sp. GW247-6E4 TaxID=3140380 RepID=UPI003315C5DC
MAASLCLAAATLGVSATQAQAQDTLKLGVIAILSGPGQPWGQALQHAVEMAVEETNAAGGLDVAGKHYQVKIIAYDSKYRPDEAMSAANRLVLQDGVKFITGPVGASETIATQSVTTANKVLTLTQGWSPRVLGPSMPYQFRVSASDLEFSGPLMNWVSQRLKFKKIGGLFPNDELGQQSSKQVSAVYEKLGIQTEIEMFERNRVDFVPLLTRLINQGIDAIDLDGNAPTTSGLIVKQARGMGFKGPILRSGGPAEQEILQVAGKEAAEGIYLYSPINPADPAIAEFMNKHKAKYGNDVNGFAPGYYDATRMLFEAMRRAGTVTDAVAVTAELEKMHDFPGIQGKLKWTGAERYGVNRQIDSAFYIMQLRDGKSVAVAKCSYTSCSDL